MRNSVHLDIDFGMGGNSGQFLCHGWYHNERTFTWTLGTESALLLEKAEYPHGFFIELAVIPRIAATGPLSQRIEIVVNGSIVGGTNLAVSATLGFFVPPVAPVDRRIIIVIRHPDAFRDKPASPDFALAVTRLRIIRAEEKLPAPDAGQAVGARAGFAGDDEAVEGMVARIEELNRVNIGQFMGRFEMLAGNCEFGGVQRAMGAEPLSLLRFAGASISTAINGLDHGFEGIGSRLSPFETDHGIKEWIVRDETHQLQFHTFVPSSQKSEADIVLMVRRKLDFLKRKFNEDLVSNHKIYVCVDRFDSPPEAMLPLFLALKRRGSTALLWVNAAKTGEPHGTVREVMPGLLHGTVDVLSKHGINRAGSMNSWLTMLNNAWQLAPSQHQSAA